MFSATLMAKFAAIPTMYGTVHECVWCEKEVKRESGGLLFIASFPYLQYVVVITVFHSSLLQPLSLPKSISAILTASAAIWSSTTAM